MDIRAISSRLDLGLPVERDTAGLRRVFAAWCSNVPFDNLQKTRALFSDPQGPLPGLNPEAFFTQWLAHGTGGTCWPYANAMHAFVSELGFDATRATASGFGRGEVGHGTVIVTLPDATHWLIDNTFMNFEPLRLDVEAPSLVDGDVHFAEVEHAAGQIFVHGTMPPIPGAFFQLVDRDVSEDVFAERYEASREKSPFNDRVHIMHGRRGRIEVLRGRIFYTLKGGGLERELLDEKGVRSHLVNTMGISETFVTDWASSGALEASLNSEESRFEGVPQRTPPSRKRLNARTDEA